MRVLLVHPHTWFADPANRRVPDTLPMGLGIVKRMLKDAGVEVDVLDIQGRNMTRPEVVSELAVRVAPDIVGISAMSTQYAYVKWLAEVVSQRFPAATIVLGGPLARFSYEVVLGCTDVDVCFTADAERHLLPFLGGGWAGTAHMGIAGNLRDELVVTPPLDTPASCDVVPDYSGFPVDTYMGDWRGWSILSGRGCSYSCDFCSRQFDGLTYRGIDSMRAELDAAPAHDHLLVADEFALATPKRAAEIASLLGEYGPWSANGRVNTVTDGMLAMLKEHRCETVSYGVESGSPAILERMNKRTTPEQIEAAIHMTAEAGIRPNPQLIFGYVGENDETLAETLAMIGRMKPDFRRYGVGLGFAWATPLPGSALYDWCFETGRLTPEGEEAYLLSLEGGFNRMRVNLTDWPDEKALRRYSYAIGELR